jgi:integrase
MVAQNGPRVPLLASCRLRYPLPRHSAAVREVTTDFVFPSLKLSGKKPRSGSQFVKDYVRPFLVKHGVISKDYRGRCGLHVFRHSLTSVMIGEKLADPKTVQSLLRHANSKVTMDVYAHALDDVKLAAQERWVERVENASMVQ